MVVSVGLKRTQSSESRLEAGLASRRIRTAVVLGLSERRRSIGVGTNRKELSRPYDMYVEQNGCMLRKAFPLVLTALVPFWMSRATTQVLDYAFIPRSHASNAILI